MGSIEDLRANRHVYRYAFACFLGVEPGAVRDLDSYNDDAWHVLSLIQFVRMCVLLDVDVESFIPRDVRRATSVPIVYIRNVRMGSATPTDDGATQVSWTIRNLLGEKINDEEFTGWDARALADWLIDDVSMGEMHIQAFEDICLALQINIVDVLTEYCRNFGR